MFQIVVDTAVLLEPKKDNFRSILDLWDAQVKNKEFRYRKIKLTVEQLIDCHIPARCIYHLQGKCYCKTSKIYWSKVSF